MGELGKETIPQAFLVNTTIKADGLPESQLVFLDSPNDMGGILEQKLCSLLNIEPDREWLEGWREQRKKAAVAIQKNMRGYLARKLKKATGAPADTAAVSPKNSREWRGCCAAPPPSTLTGQSRSTEDSPEMLDRAFDDRVRNKADGEAATPRQSPSARTPTAPTTADRATSARIARETARQGAR